MKGNFKIGNKKLKFKYELPWFYYSMPEVQKQIPNYEAYVNYIFDCNHKSDFLNYLCSNIKFIKGHSVIDEGLDGIDIKIKSNMISKMTNSEQDTFVLYAQNLFGILDIQSEMNANIAPEIIYIGKSKGVINRIKKHEKTTLFMNQLKDDEELIYYFLEFDTSSIEQMYNNGLNFAVLVRDELDAEKNDEIDAIEAVLINHFKPVVNRLEVDGEPEKNKKVIKYIANKGFNKINIEIESDGLFSCFGSGVIPKANRHEININLNELS